MEACPHSNQRGVQSIVAVLTCIPRIVAMRSLPDCVEEVCSFGDRRDTARQHTRAAASAMHTLLWQACFQ